MQAAYPRAPLLRWRADVASLTAAPTDPHRPVLPHVCRGASCLSTIAQQASPDRRDRFAGVNARGAPSGAHAQICIMERMCYNFVVEPKDGVDDRKFSSSQRTDRE